MRQSASDGGAGREEGARARDEKARQRRAADHRPMEDREVERKGPGKILWRNQPWDERLSGGAIEGHCRGREGVESVDAPDRVAASEREDREACGDRRHRQLRVEHHPPPVAAVRDDPAPERKNDDGEDSRQANEAEGEGRARQQVDVPVDGHDLHLGACERDELGDPELPELAVAEGEVRAARACFVHTGSHSLADAARPARCLREARRAAYIYYPARASDSPGWIRSMRGNVMKIV